MITQTEKIQTKGMHCTSCEMLVKDSLNEMEGVTKTLASFKTGIVTVEFDTKKIDIKKIKEVIRKEGYKVF